MVYIPYIVYDIVWIALICEKWLFEAKNKNRRVASIIIIICLQVLSNIVSSYTFYFLDKIYIKLK